MDTDQLRAQLFQIAAANPADEEAARKKIDARGSGAPSSATAARRSSRGGEHRRRRHARVRHCASRRRPPADRHSSRAIEPGHDARTCGPDDIGSTGEWRNHVAAVCVPARSGRLLRTRATGHHHLAGRHVHPDRSRQPAHRTRERHTRRRRLSTWGLGRGSIAALGSSIKRRAFRRTRERLTRRHHRSAPGGSDRMHTAMANHSNRDLTRISDAESPSPSPRGFHPERRGARQAVLRGGSSGMTWPALDLDPEARPAIGLGRDRRNRSGRDASRDTERPRCAPTA